MTWQKVELNEEVTALEKAEALVKSMAIDETPTRVDQLKEIFNEVSKGRSRGRPAKTKLSSGSSDPVNHPAHYTDGGIETIDYIEAKQLNYHLGNVVKYVSRAGKKSAMLQDLEKAKWYLDREIARLKAQDE